MIYDTVLTRQHLLEEIVLPNCSRRDKIIRAMGDRDSWTLGEIIEAWDTLGLYEIDLNWLLNFFCNSAELFYKYKKYNEIGAGGTFLRLRDEGRLQEALEEFKK